MAQIERNRFGHYLALAVNCGGSDSLPHPNLLDCCNLPEITERYYCTGSPIPVSSHL